MTGSIVLRFDLARLADGMLVVDGSEVVSIDVVTSVASMDLCVMCTRAIVRPMVDFFFQAIP